MKYRSSAALLAILAISAAAYAQDVFTDTATYKKFYVEGVPNFDQRRENSSVTIGSSNYLLLGLNNNGSEYCCPTSAIEWTDFLANRGWPNLLPGPGPMTGSYTGGVADLGQYNLVDLSIAFMGADMQTSGTGGTYGGPAQTGAQQFYDAEYPGYFNLVNIERDSSGFPHIMDMLNASLAGNLIELYGGWYVPIAWNNTTAYYRNGGHCVAMASAIWNNNPSISLGICNPWTDDSLFVQSPQGYSPETTTNADEWFVNVNSSNQVISGSQQYENVDFLDKSANWIFDGALEVQPFCGYTIKSGWIYWLNPIKFVNIPVNVTNVPPPYKIFKSPDNNPILNAARNPLTGEFYYFTSTKGIIYKADPVSGETTRMKTDFMPRQIVFGASMQPFILTGEGTVAMWNLSTGSLSNGLNLGVVTGIGYDHEADAYYWYRIGTDGQPTKFGLLYKPVGQDHFVAAAPINLPVTPKGRGALSVQIHGGSLWLYQSGDPNLYEILPGGSSGYIAHLLLPAVQKATGFAFDDMGNLYFCDGSVLVSDLNGNAVTSPFSNLPAGAMIEMSHSVSNYRPWLQGTPAWNNTVPEGVFGNK